MNKVGVDFSEVKLITNRLNILKNSLTPKVQKQIARKAAKPLLKAVRAKIKDSDGPHKRYSGGKVLATYLPGNLRKSMKILTFRRSKNSVFVGPKVSKKNTKGTFGSGARVDGYYAHMYEHGTAHYRGRAPLRSSYAEMKGAILLILRKEYLNEIKNITAKWR